MFDFTVSICAWNCRCISDHCSAVGFTPAESAWLISRMLVDRIRANRVSMLSGAVFSWPVTWGGSTRAQRRNSCTVSLPPTYVASGLVDLLFLSGLLIASFISVGASFSIFSFRWTARLSM